MKKIVILNKKEGETPLRAMERFRSKNRKYKEVKMTYAGRLDPMAEGALLVLLGEEVKKKEKYLKLTKEYEFQVLFGASTDTYDILGKVTKVKEPGEIKGLIEKNIKHYKGKFKQKYPLYSSKTVKGKPLFSYGREGVEVELPEREVKVTNIKFLNLKTVSSKTLLSSIKRRIGKVEGDFRQKEIIRMWEKSLKKGRRFCIGSFQVKCSSGTYVRGIANSLGEKIDIPALAFSIKRTRIGKWGI